jgi:hypothetical protein
MIKRKLERREKGLWKKLSRGRRGCDLRKWLKTWRK